MTIEITLLPISCRTLHRLWKFIEKVVITISVWISLIFGVFIVIIPQSIQEIFGSPANGLSANDILLMDRIGGICFITAAILFMTIIYDIKINLCIKEKPE